MMDTFLAMFDLQVSPMPPTKFQVSRWTSLCSRRSVSSLFGHTIIFEALNFIYWPFFHIFRIYGQGNLKQG